MLSGSLQVFLCINGLFLSCLLTIPTISNNHILILLINLLQVKIKNLKNIVVNGEEVYLMRINFVLPMEQN